MFQWMVQCDYERGNRWKILEFMVLTSRSWCDKSLLCHEKVSNVIKYHKMWLLWPAAPCHGEVRGQRIHLWLSWHRRHDRTPVSRLAKMEITSIICRHLSSWLILKFGLSLKLDKEKDDEKAPCWILNTRFWQIWKLTESTWPITIQYSNSLTNQIPRNSFHLSFVVKTDPQNFGRENQLST